MMIPMRARRMLVLVLTVAAMALAGEPAVMARQKAPITWSVTSVNASVKAGASVRVEITARIEDGWHLYSLTQQAPPDPTRITVPDGQPFTLGGKIEAPAPETGFDKAQDSETEYYTESVSFKVPLKAAAATTAPGRHVAHIRATWQACNGVLCIRPQVADLNVPIQVSAAK
ncbi:MAG: protein-disulfide reductase DsbD N-terminal domain-containing protein [Acidobacteria bacterium]|nr:protein-disulfide reductase DsbD N-terminal domain-containing protein [Acidobacteriota bacterium]